MHRLLITGEAGEGHMNRQPLYQILLPVLILAFFLQRTGRERNWKMS